MAGTLLAAADTSVGLKDDKTGGGRQLPAESSKEPLLGTQTSSCPSSGGLTPPPTPEIYIQLPDHGVYDPPQFLDYYMTKYPSHDTTTTKQQASSSIPLPRIRLQLASCESLHTVHIPTPVCHSRRVTMAKTTVILGGMIREYHASVVRSINIRG
ncbi:hypothetical protein FOZ61_003352 [Perkinsus olseni]|uniref:Uncharacterized protein n=1 Tax=Perkinsus olseni TaxID=32597 RepID=A0A7J6LQE2_PEROL|nr:hypothetical protein FOZ61_003352 [Perkinsus olseni]